MISKFALVAATVLFTVMGCKNSTGNSGNVVDKSTNQQPAESPSKKSVEESEKAWLHATVSYQRMEGGFYGLITHDGKKLFPLNLATEYRQAGAVIRFKGHVEEGVMTIQQWGKPFKISDLQLIKEGRKKVPDTH